MANYTAADIKELRERTGAGMLDVKKALDEAEGDKSKAQELLRIKGLKGVTKREGRTTSNGLVVAKAEAGVGTLVLTHQVPAPQPGTEDEWVALAAERFDGTVVMGVDLTTVTV